MSRPGKLFLSDGEGHDGNVIGRDAGSRQFLVETDVGIAVDGGDHADLLAVSTKGHDVGHDLGPVGMAEGRVVDEDILFRDALAHQIGLKDVVGRARINVVGSQEGEFLDAQFLKEIIRSRDRLLVWRRTGVEDVLGAFLALILHRVEQQAVQFLDDRQNRLAAYRGPVAEDHVDIVYREKLTRLLGKERPVGGRVHNHGFELLAQYAALCVLLVDEHQHRIFQRGFGDGHRARERMQNANLDRLVLREQRAGERAGGSRDRRK